MTTPDMSATAIPLNKGLLMGGAVLVAAGGILTATGIVLATYTVASAVRQWSKRLETPPNELARQRLQQARTASSAAREAWRQSGTSSEPA